MKLKEIGEKNGKVTFSRLRRFSKQLMIHISVMRRGTKLLMKLPTALKPCSSKEDTVVA